MRYDLTRKSEFENVAMPHTERLSGTALRLTHDRAAAEDVVQETLLCAWSSFHSFERGTNCKAWLFRIMLNLIGKRRQKTRTAPTLLSLDDDHSLVVIPLPVVTSQFSAREILSALNTLSEEHRTVLILAVVEGFTCKEIAQMGRIPIGTVMSRLSRARAEIKKKLIYESQKKHSSALAG